MAANFKFQVQCHGDGGGVAAVAAAAGIGAVGGLGGLNGNGGGGGGGGSGKTKIRYVFVFDKVRLQRCTKRWTCFAKQQPGIARQKCLAT